MMMGAGSQLPSRSARQARRPRSSRVAPRASSRATASAPASAGTGEVRTAWRAGGADAAGAGTLCTSGLAPAGRSVTSLISCPLTSGPETGAGAGGLITGAGWRGVRGCEPVVRAGVVSVFAPEVVGVVDVELGVVAVWLVVEVEGLLWPDV